MIIKKIEIKPDSYDAWYNKGIIFADYLGMNKEALEAFNKAIEINPDFHDECNKVIKLLNIHEETIKAKRKINGNGKN